MKITGKIISVILAVILLIGMMPMSVFAEGVITYLDDPDVVITTTIDPQPDEEPVASPGFDVKVDNWGGSGTEDDPFTIHNRVGMENLSILSARGYSFSGIYFALDGDFSMEGVVIGAQYATIGSEENPFAGVFDGRGHTISGYSLNDSGKRVGLFRVVTGTIKNLNLSGSVSATGSAAVGGIVGKNCGTLRNCAFYGTVSCSGGSPYAGGIAGENAGMVYQCTNYAAISNTTYGDTGGVAGNSKSGTVKSCHNKGDVTGKGRAGGITAVSENYTTSRKTISECTNSGTVTGANGVGGIVSSLYRCAAKDCVNSGKVIGVNDIGGIVGNAQYSNIINCENSGDLDAPEKNSYSNWGGIVGYFSGKNEIQGCMNTGTVDPSYEFPEKADNFGGIVGFVEDGNTIASCCNLGTICCSVDGGGIFGDGRGAEIKNCFNAGRLDISDGKYDTQGDSGGGIGGFAQECEITECGNVGKVFAEKYAGGIVGYAKFSHLANCYSASVVTATKIAGGIGGRFDNSSLAASISIGYIESKQDEKFIDEFFNWLFYGEGKWDSDPDPQFGAVLGSRTNSDDPDLYTALSKNYYYQFDVTHSYQSSFSGMFDYGYEYSCPASGIGTGKDSEYTETEIRGLTEYQYRYRPDEDIYATWDFQNIWYMTDWGPRLRHVGPLSDGGEYHVRTVDDLIKMRNMVNAGMPMKNVTVKLESDLDLSAYENWTPIGGEEFTAAAVFSGTFDGGNHTISGLNIDTKERLSGLFGNVDGTVKNLKLTGNIKGDEYVGGIAAFLYGGTIENCYVSMSGFGGREAMGGIAAAATNNAVIRRCTYSGSVQGCTDKDKIDEDYGYVGGLVGLLTGGSLMEECSFDGGEITGTDGTGGLVGVMSNATMQNCIHRAGDIDAPAGQHVGGVAGFVGTKGKIINCCHCAGQINGVSYVGGVAGSAVKEINSSIGSGTAFQYGLEHCYYRSGTVQCSKTIGGSDTTDRGIGVKTVTGIGIGVTEDANPSGVAQPLSASELNTQSKFKNWDFNTIWAMGDDHPELAVVCAPVTFDANGGSGTMSPYLVPAFGGNLPGCGFSRSGYAFLGWNTASDASGTFYRDKTHVDGLSPLTLYAVWGVRQNVSYVDLSGKTQTAENCIGLHDKLVTLESGWYFVDGSVNYNKRIEINGDVNLILKDGSSLTNKHGIHVPTDSTLTVWGQESRCQIPGFDYTTQGTGQIMAENGDSTRNDENAAIGSNVGEAPGEIRINGGVITASAAGGAAIGGAKGESGNFVTLSNCCVTASCSGFGSAAIGGGEGGDGGSVFIKNAWVKATGELSVRKIGGYQKSFSSSAIGAGVPDNDEDGSFEELYGVNIGIEDSYVHAEAGHLEESATVDARAIGSSLLNDYDIHRISSLSGVMCEVDGVPVEYERIPYFCTRHSVDIKPCTKHVGRQDDYHRCRYCNADFEYQAVVLVCDYNYTDSPAPFSYAANDKISFKVSDKIAVPEGAYFKGWNTAKDGSGTMYAPGDTITVDGKTSLYAQWGGTKPVVYADENGLEQTVTANVLSEQDAVLSDGWYIAEGALTYNSRLAVSGDVKLILADDCKLTANVGIGVPEGSSLTIYGQTGLYDVPDETVQTFGTGVLYAKTSGSSHAAAIGGNERSAAGTVTINGGVVTAQGRFGAGIGAGDVGTCGTVNIHNGCVTATGDRGSAGIGGGGYAGGGTVNITGGYVKATGSIYSDTRQAVPGIGSGRPRANGSQPLSPGTVTITGGTVIASAGIAPEGGTGAMAIGVNLADEAQMTEDSLTIGDQMRVTAGGSADASAVSLYADRVTACRGQYARIEVCKEHAVTENDHIHCAYCGKELPVDVKLYGDANLDGSVTISDVTEIQRYLAELADFSDKQLLLADTNGDGLVDITDATHLQKYLAEYDVVLGKQTA